MSELLELYAYILKNLSIKDELIKDELELVKNEEKLLMGLGILNEIIDTIALFDKKVFINRKLESICYEFSFIKDYLINSYGQINGYIVYDFLKNEYDRFLSVLKEIMNF